MLLSFLCKEVNALCSPRFVFIDSIPKIVDTCLDTSVALTPATREYLYKAHTNAMVGLIRSDVQTRNSSADLRIEKVMPSSYVKAIETIESIVDTLDSCKHALLPLVRMVRKKEGRIDDSSSYTEIKLSVRDIIELKRRSGNDLIHFTLSHPLTISFRAHSFPGSASPDFPPACTG